MFVPWHLQDKYGETKAVLVEDNKEEQKSASQDSFIETAIKDEEKQATVYHRYYHVFKKGELEDLITENFTGLLEIKENYYDHANWAVVCEKLN